MKDLHDENITQYYNPIVGKIFSNKGLKVEKIKEKKQNEIMFFVKKNQKKKGWYKHSGCIANLCNRKIQTENILIAKEKGTWP